METLLVVFQFAAGCGLLAWGADRFIFSSSIIAKRLNMPPLVIGMLMVGFGTSLPEMVVSAIAAAHGKPEIAIGNAVGSNITNIGLVLGIIALIAPITVASRVIKREFPILIAVTVGVGALLWNGDLSRIDGMILVAMLVVYLVWLLVWMPRESARDPIIEEFQHELPGNHRALLPVIAWWLFGLVLLWVSSELIVDGAVTIARWFHISELVIGLTIVSVGTSLPELAASVVSVLRGEDDIAIGNVVGSNIFNLLAVLAMPALISPTGLSKPLLLYDYPIMTGFTLLFCLFAYLPKSKLNISRFEGGLLLASYLGYIVYLIFRM